MIYISLAILAIIAFGLTYLAYHRARQAAKFDAAVSDIKDIVADKDSFASRQWDVRK